MMLQNILSILCVLTVESLSLPMTNYMYVNMKYTRGLNVHLSVVSVTGRSLSKPIRMHTLGDTQERDLISVTSVVTFKQSGHLQQHKRRFHLPQSQLPKRVECPSSFAQKWDLDIHILTHKKGLEARPYEYPKCGCAFTQPSSCFRDTLL